MADKWPDDEGYPDALTRDVMKFYEATSEIPNDDRGDALDKLVAALDTETLTGAFRFYEDCREDAEKPGSEEEFSAWDHEVLFRLRQELLSRGLRPLPRELATAAMMDDPNATRH